MKKLLILAAAVCTLAACEKPSIDEAAVPSASPDGKRFTFTLKGDFSDEWKPVTRGYLQADGKDLTDVWVLDYQDGALVQQLHQSDNTAADFGKPSMTLAYGSHHIYFVASRGTGATLNTTDKTIIFSRTFDTFWQDYEVTVVSTSNGNRAVTLDRVVTRLKLGFTDAVSADAATFNITPHTWYFGIKYQTAEPVEAKTDYTFTIQIPASEIGSTTTTANIFGFSSATEWSTDVAVNSKKSDGTVIGSATIHNAPFKRNRITEYTGPLFNGVGDLTLSLNTTWDSSVTGTW